MTVDLAQSAPAVAAAPPPRRRRSPRRQSLVGWGFVAPFAVVFLAFLVAPLLFALYLSLFQNQLIGGTRFVGIANYAKAFTDPNFLDGIWFVLRFSLVLIPLQMAVSLTVALILDVVTGAFARFSRLMIFLPYAIPAVIGALMWGFLYSKSFGPVAELFGMFGLVGPDFLSRNLIFFGLLNIVTWQWAGYYMIILYAALQGIDPTLYEAARIDGASQWQIVLRIKIPLIAPALVLILVFALIGTLQFFNEPQILRYLAAGAIPADFTPNMYAYQQAFALANYNYGSAISFALGAVVFVCVYIFLFITRKRGSFLS
ncbi:sugar ABC transporter permease [Microbacterium sp. zg.Y1090]|uniref:carbohydrate ABC transporter permease n=1 Tax=Microbacterium TaxID=33882 RepID=UPI00214C5819|nr:MULTISPECIES: sugar ABC transporter permease [unclassified Microbacterium]MCR2812331.1 sugar ABC transporter permease [Microbacterium sp. zg.Y1084]MCR2819779.1 sugar ABC transporter permease [Microbacterium sp. zg.Y1090]MDL5485488.1 sugar ABC transporter permease [Microbacterium sp. zg-Y1211]WIM28660.1 sugar ABC transporter permease [Microbacterium sp. zg-Y1090]